MQTVAKTTLGRLRVELDHFVSSDYRNFYEPSDDTWLFTDGLEKDVQFIVALLLSTSNDECRRNRLNWSAEVGSGSGYVTTFLMKLLMRHGGVDLMNQMFFLCTDINPQAANATRKTLEYNGVPMNQVDVVQGSFLSALMPRLKNEARILLFNPPYVPSEEHELGHDDCHAAYAGGRNGREVIDVFMPLVKDILTPTGSVCYMIAIEDNKPLEIMEIMSTEDYGSFKCSIVMRKKVLGEILYLLKFAR